MGCSDLWHGSPRDAMFSLEVRAGLAAGPFISLLQKQFRGESNKSIK
jgi:hypothetical protein